MPAELVQLGGSLVAILALFLLARALHLGGAPELPDADALLAAGRDQHPAFRAERSALSRDGSAGLLADKAGRILLMAPHGAHMVGHLLDARAKAQVDGDLLHVHTGYRMHRSHTLDLGDHVAQQWFSLIAALRSQETESH